MGVIGTQALRFFPKIKPIAEKFALNSVLISVIEYCKGVGGSH